MEDEPRKDSSNKLLFDAREAFAKELMQKIRLMTRYKEVGDYVSAWEILDSYWDMTRGRISDENKKKLLALFQEANRIFGKNMLNKQDNEGAYNKWYHRINYQMQDATKDLLSPTKSDTGELTEDDL